MIKVANALAQLQCHFDLYIYIYIFFFHFFLFSFSSSKLYFRCPLPRQLIWLKVYVELIHRKKNDVYTGCMRYILCFQKKKKKLLLKLFLHFHFLKKKEVTLVLSKTKVGSPLLGEDRASWQPNTRKSIPYQLDGICCIDH